MRSSILMAGIAALCLVTAGCRRATGAMRPLNPDPAPSAASFQSGGKTIPLERFDPKGTGKHPAVILLHGADGLQVPLWNALYRGYARQLADHGYIVFFPHYMDRTGTKWASGREIIVDFIPWSQTVGDCITYAVSQPDVDKDRVGTMGLSLGASLVLANAALDPRIKTVVEYFGAMPPLLAPSVTRMPPVLILHCDKDPLVPVKSAYDLEKLLKEHNLPYEMHIYPNQGHGFIGADGLDAMQRTIRFFDKYLASRP